MQKYKQLIEYNTTSGANVEAIEQEGKNNEMRGLKLWMRTSINS